MSMGRGGRGGSSCGGFVGNGGLWWPGEASEGCALLLLLLLQAEARGDNCHPAGASNEAERFTVPKEELLLLANECCCWSRRERLQPWLSSERNLRPRERELLVVLLDPRVARWLVFML